MRAPNVKRIIFLATGWICFVLGLVGIVVPLLPTTIFWILAAWCWLRSSPALSEKILSHPRFGEPVRLFLERGQISSKGKCYASSGISLGYLIFLLTVQPSWLLAGMVGAVLLAVIGWIILLPKPGAVSEKRSG